MSHRIIAEKLINSKPTDTTRARRVAGEKKSQAQLVQEEVFSEQNPIKVMLPDGTVMELDNKDEVNELVARYENEGFEVMRQGDFIIITSTPKQA